MQYQYIIGQPPIDEEEKLALIPPLVTRLDLDKLEQANITEARKWLMNKNALSKYNITDLAIIFHHRLVKIHLFANGNVRHARLMADGIIAKYNGQTLSWGSNSDLTKPDEIRKNYISALREADRGNYEPILKFARS
jgi:Fic family protein